MAFTPRLQPNELVTPKEREELAKKKIEYTSFFNDHLNRMPDSWYKQELMEKRDHCLKKFPVFPRDLSIWVVAYYEDWLKQLGQVPDSER